MAGAIVGVLILIAYSNLASAFGTFQHDLDFRRALPRLRASDSALEPNPYRDSGLAYTLYALGRRRQAEAVLLDATHRWPRELRVWMPLAQVQLGLGKAAAARATWAHARSLDPHLRRELPPPPHFGPPS